MYRIRFHGRGGQGIKTASRVLGCALFSEGFEVQDAPVYGAERRGAPMFAYVRASRTPIRERGLIANPDLVVVADESLVALPAANVLLGVSPHTVLLLASAERPETWQARLNHPAAVVNLPNACAQATPGAVGTATAGAAARLLSVISRRALERAIREELEPLGAAAVRANLSCALAAFDALAGQAGVVREGEAIPALGYAPPEWIEVPSESDWLSAPHIHAVATSTRAATGAWRTLRPVIDYEHCKRCAWVCSTLCPDSAISVDAQGAPRIDYDHCKGCMVCVAVCPPHAIRAEPERAAAAEATA